MKKPANLARELIERHETRNPYVICRREGVAVRPHALMDVRGYYINPFGVPIIGLSGNLSELTRTYVCFHELGHHLYDGGLNRVFMDYFTYMAADRYENRVDTFAVHALFGEKPLYSDFHLDDNEMAEILNVPARKVNSRLVELGIYW